MAEKKQSLSKLVVDRSQGFRVPLSSIMGYLKLIREDKGLSENVSRHLNSIESAAHQLQSLVTNLQTRVRFVQDEFALDLSTVSLEGLLVEIEHVATPQAVSKGLKFTATITPRCARYVLLDKSRSKQMLVNLVRNSLTYTQKGFVSVTFDQVDNDLVFTVIDSGPGLQAEEIKKLSTSQKSDPSDTVTGLGLGLSITKSLIESMKGELDIKSTQGEGSTIIVKVPYKESEEHKNFLRTQPVPVVPIKVDQVLKTVLLIENNLETSNFLAFLLKRGGYEVTVAEDWMLGLAFLSELEFDIVMPNLEAIDANAPEIIEKLRTLGFTKDVIALTDNNEAAHETKLIAAGYAACLTKPIQMTALFAVIKRANPGAS